jgi:hypothetical protein
VALLPLAVALTACGASSPAASHSASAGATPSGPAPTAAGTNAVSLIAAPTSACTSFAAGTLAPLPRLTPTLASGAITKTNPASFVYWLKVVPATTGLTHLNVTETTQGATLSLTPTGGQVQARAPGATPACSPVTSSVNYGTGPAVVTFDGTAGTTYYAQVTYSTLALTGQKPGSGGITLSFNAGLPGSTASVPVAG